MTQKAIASFPNIDLSDRLARESVLLEQLTDLDPDGRWKSHELYQRRRQRRYGGLTIGQMDDLLDYLESEINQIPPERIRQWLTRHQEPEVEDDAQTQSIQPTETPMA